MGGGKYRAEIYRQPLRYEATEIAMVMRGQFNREIVEAANDWQYWPVRGKRKDPVEYKFMFRIEKLFGSACAG